jgi:hypothetical protein
MRSSSLESIRKHLGKSVDIKVGNDHLEWPSLDPEHLNTLLGMAFKYMDANKAGGFDKSVIEDVYILGVASMKKIYPELTEKEMRQFIATNFTTVLSALIEANNLTDTEDKSKEDKIMERVKGLHG